MIGHFILSEAAADLRQAAMKAEQICFFGLGTLFEDCYSQLVLAVGRSPDMLCDNAPAKWGRSFFGIPCVSPHELPERREGVLVVICVRNFEKICIRLEEMGFDNIFVVNFERSYHRVGSIRRQDSAVADVRVLSLQGRWALVTGSTRGIGRQIAIALARQGANVVIHGRVLEHTEQTVWCCRELGVEAVAVAGDLGKSDELEALAGWLRDSAPPIDILFNNAGISPSDYGGFWQMPAEAYHASYAVNLIAPVRLSQQLIPSMIERGFGRVVNISSSIQRRPAEMAYACSKAALDKFVFDLQSELAGTGVQMSLLDPGWLRTDMGGAVAPNGVESVLPGALLGAVIDGNVSGGWFAAQDYTGMSIEDAIRKAIFIGACAPDPLTVRKSI
ncbi:MAG: SDR family oxidoreductase [Sulfuricella denitrificans]|nr:SDR family oxidoreductase [Sulfuricella denitrificans]